MRARAGGVVVGLLLWAGLAQGTTWIVCPTQCPYTSLAEAIAAAAPGDTILVQPGTYPGDVWLKKPLDIRSAGDEPGVIEGHVYVLGTGQVTLHGLTVHSGGIHLEDSSGVLISDCAVEGPSGIVIRSASVTVRDTAVTGAADHGILVTLGSRALIAGCTISGAGKDGIHIAASLADLRDNEVQGSGGYGIWGDSHATVSGQATLASLSGNARGTVGGTALALDRDPPAAPAGLTVSPEEWTAGEIAIAWAPPEDLTGIAAAWYTIGSAPQGPEDGTRAVGNPFLVASPPEGEHVVYVWLEDHAGNRNEKACAEALLRADRTPPSGEVAGNSGSQHVFAPQVTLTIEASDLAGTEPGSGVASLRLSNDGRTWGPWQPFAPSVAWDLAGSGGSAAPGAKTVAIELRDRAGNTSRITTELTLVPSLASSEPILCLAVAGNRLAHGAPSGTIRVVDPTTGKEALILRGHTGGVYALAFSPDGKTLASGSNDNTVRLWDVATGKEVRVLRGHTGGVWTVAFSPDGKTLASGSSDATVRLWAVSTGRAWRTLSGHTGAVRAVAFSPDGKALASGSDDHTVRVWEVGSGRLKHTLTEHSGAVRSVAFSPDGKLLGSAGADGKALLWDGAAGKLARTLAPAGPELRAVAFAPDGESVATASATGTVVVWDVATGKERDTLPGHTAQVNALAYTADGRTLASGGADKVVRLWQVEP
ncbi:MAG: right-handed parallel beta-helix repeat-containing protein [Candidatus Bipolaricaulis sp.]